MPREYDDELRSKMLACLQGNHHEQRNLMGQALLKPTKPRLWIMKAFRCLSFLSFLMPSSNDKREETLEDVSDAYARVARLLVDDDRDGLLQFLKHSMPHSLPLLIVDADGKTISSFDVFLQIDCPNVDHALRETLQKKWCPDPVSFFSTPLFPSRNSSIPKTFDMILLAACSHCYLLIFLNR